jgi:hypothetical protein
MTSFATFGLLYMSALFLELAERWAFPFFTAAILGLIVVFAASGITRITFLIFLVLSTGHLLWAQMPDVANHVNLIVFCNVMMMSAIVYSLIRRREFPTEDACFEMMRPLLQGTVILMYFLAGFHKLNTDFINPQVSCVTMMVDGLAKIASSGISSSAASPVVAAMILAVIAWELIGGLLLAVPRFQGAILAFSWIMHATFAFIGFVDFAALALALLFTFVPRPFADLLDSRVRIPVLSVKVHRAYLYVAVNAAGSMLTLFPAITWRIDVRFWTGLLFNVAALVFIWPLLSRFVTSRAMPGWIGLSLRKQKTPRWMWAFHALLLAYGLTSYLGLRTAGNFSMFSNLRTEGVRSNHFLLAGNPLKVWAYQEDVVRFAEIDDTRARIGYQYQPLKGNALPVVEFRKLIRLWTAAGVTLPMTFEYQGRTHTTNDIVNDAEWGRPARDWEMMLMDFRVIQTEGPNRCRW